MLAKQMRSESLCFVYSFHKYRSAEFPNLEVCWKNMYGQYKSGFIIEVSVSAQIVIYIPAQSLIWTISPVFSV